MRVFICITSLVLAANALAQTFEAESGNLSGTVVSDQRSGYLGSGYVTGFDIEGDKVTMTFSSAGGVYDLYLRYTSPFGDKFNFIYVNGHNAGRVAFSETLTFAEIKIGKIFLRQGVNTVAIVKDWGYFEVDNIRIEASSASVINNVSTALITPSSTARTDSVFRFLLKIYGKAMLSGQYGGSDEFDYLRDISGKTPVIRGFDLIDYSPSRVERGATSSEIEKAVVWDRERGITTFCWHWNAPTGLIDQPGKEWWRGFYTDATTFDITIAMTDPASEEYKLILRDIDAIAVQLEKLRDADVPVLWRPLHEAEGKWFWWGAKGAEPCRWLWRLLYDRLVNYHGLNNLIWVWTSSAGPDALKWYPGDDYVDILGADVYMPAGAHGSWFTLFDNIAAMYQGKKMIALSENGPMPDPQRCFLEEAAWSWFATWSGDFIMNGEWNSATHIQRVYNHDYVITLDEIDRVDEILILLEQRRQDGPAPVTRLTEDNDYNISFENPLINNKVILRSTDSPLQVEVFTLHGKKELEFNLSSAGEMDIDFQNKPVGIYLLRIRGLNSVKVYRVVKR